MLYVAISARLKQHDVIVQRKGTNHKQAGCKVQIGASCEPIEGAEAGQDGPLGADLEI